jgi:hypothetical protein
MTKNNKVECWKPKNCGKNFGKSSSKCGDCITLQLQLLDNWVPAAGSGGNFPNAIAIATLQFVPEKSFPSTNFAIFEVQIPPEAKKGDVFSVGICKSIITNDTLYYLIGDAYVLNREESFIPFPVITSKCVNTIPIDNSCPKYICQKTTITFVLTDTNDKYIFSGETTYTSSKNNDCSDYTPEADSIDTNTLTLTNVVNKSIIVDPLTVTIGNTKYYYKNPSGLIIDLTQKCSQTITLSKNVFSQNPP